MHPSRGGVDGGRSASRPVSASARPANPGLGGDVRGGKLKKPHRKDPLWARLLVGFGALLMFGSGTLIVGIKVLVAQTTKNVTQTNLLGDAGTHHVDVNGPVNVLLVGTDGRPDNSADLGRADSIIILHVTASHNQAYLISIPRDTLVQIPADRKANYAGGKNKINSAFSYGARNGGGFARGTALLAATIKAQYGIGFDAAAVVNFDGFRQVVGVLGGVDMCVDEKTTSIHVGWTASGKETVPFTQNAAATKLYPVKGVRPQVYYPGCQHLSAWKALDYTRQRDLLANGDGDYGRQRHQQQFVKAIFKGILSKGTLTNPAKLTKVLDAVGNAMTIDRGGVPLEDWVYAMRGIGSNSITTIKTNNGQFVNVDVPGVGSCQSLNSDSLQLLADVKTDTVDSFLSTHTDWVSQS